MCICGTLLWQAWQTNPPSHHGVVILWRQKLRLRFSTCFLRHVYFFTKKSPANKLVKFTRLFNISLKTTAPAHVNCRLVNTFFRKKRCTGLVSKTLQAFLYFLWHGQHPGILSPFTSYLCVTQIPRFATHFNFPSCWTGIFGSFFRLSEYFFLLLAEIMSHLPVSWPNFIFT